MDLARIMAQALTASGNALHDGDILCLAQKIVSKAEDRFVELASVTPSRQARELAHKVDKDPRLIELVLAESREIIALRPGLIIVEHNSGVILANAGIDHSNIGNADDGGERVLLLPRDPDASARALRESLLRITGKQVGILVTDSIGRPWRLGSVGVAIGAAGFQTLRDLRGRHDMYDRRLLVSETADADALAAAACLMMGEADEATPVVLIRGYPVSPSGQGARCLLRDKSQDLFRP